MATDFTVTVANEPGVLAEIARAMGDAGINLSSVASDGDGVETDMHVLVEDAGAARKVLRSIGATVTAEQPVVVVQATDEPGALAQLAERVADAGINLTLIYVATGTRVVFGADDIESLREVLT